MGSAQRVEEGRGSVRPFLDVACGETDCRAFAVVRRVHLRQAALGVVEMPHLLLCAVCGMAMPALASWCGPVRNLEEDELSELRDRWAEQHAGVTHRIEVLEENMSPKITRHGGPTNRYTEGECQDAGTGEPMEAIVVAADGTEHELTGDGSGRALPDAHSNGESEPSDQANAMVNDTGDLFFPDNEQDARSIREGHDARPVNPDRFAEIFPGLDFEGGEQPSAGNSSETSPEKPPPSEKPSGTVLPKRARATGSRSRKGRGESSTAPSTAGPGPETAPEGDG